MDEWERLEATVHGIVQGVFFRHHARIEAARLDLTGTVQNLPDGTVRVIAEGPRDRLDRLLVWLHRGPDLAVVEQVDVEWKTPTGSGAAFDIVR